MGGAVAIEGVYAIVYVGVVSIFPKALPTVQGFRRPSKAAG